MQTDTEELTPEDIKIIKSIQQAWRERWTEEQWSIAMKSIFPRHVSGDSYNLSDRLMEQAMIGTTANTLMFVYIKNSLYTHLISHAAVLLSITRYEWYDRLYSMDDLLNLTLQILPSVTCRQTTEEFQIIDGSIQLMNWLMKLMITIADTDEKQLDDVYNCEIYIVVMEKCCKLLKMISNIEYLIAVIYVGSSMQSGGYKQMQENYNVLSNRLSNTRFHNAAIEQCLRKIVRPPYEAPNTSTLNTPELTFYMQPILSIDVLLRPHKPVEYFVGKLQMLQHLNKFSKARLLYEFIRAALMPLSTSNDNNYDTIWAAFLFFKMPKIIKQFHSIDHPSVKTEEEAKEPTPDYVPDVVEAFEMLISGDVLFDFLDVKWSCNSIEFLLKEWSKHKLVNEMHVKHFATQRESFVLSLANSQAPSIVNFIVRAEISFSGVLKTLGADYNKVQEALLGVLCQVLVGNSFELISSIATVEERLTLFAQRLIHCNENSKQVAGEMGKNSVTRSILFDVSFLMLTSLVQCYGLEVVLPDNGDSFFEKWVHDYLPESNQRKNYRNMLAQCDENIVDELLQILKAKPESQLKNSNISWQDTCINLPGVLHNVLIAWEKETLTNADIQNLVDNIKRRLCCFSVCAVAFICGYIYSVNETERIKPMNMIQQFLVPLNADDVTNQDNYKERTALLYQIIKKIRSDTQCSSEVIIRGYTLPDNQNIHATINQQVGNWWKKCMELGWLSNNSCLEIYSLLQNASCTSLTRCFIQKLLKYSYLKEMKTAKEFIFGIMHLDIEHFTSTLLKDITIEILLLENKRVKRSHLENLADLCVKCIIMTMELNASLITEKPTTSKKRRHSHDTGEALTQQSGRKAIENYMPELPSLLENSLLKLFSHFRLCLERRAITLQTTFIHKFVSFLLEYDPVRIRPILHLMLPKLRLHTLQLSPWKKINPDFIIRIHDIIYNPMEAIGDLTRWRNRQLKPKRVRIC